MPAQDQPQGLPLLVGQGVEAGGHEVRFKAGARGEPPRIFWVGAGGLKLAPRGDEGLRACDVKRVHV